MDKLKEMIATLDAELDKLHAQVQEKQREYDKIDRELTALKHTRDWCKKALAGCYDFNAALIAVAVDVLPDDPAVPL